MTQGKNMENRERIKEKQNRLESSLRNNLLKRKQQQKLRTLSHRSQKAHENHTNN